MPNPFIKPLNKADKVSQNYQVYKPNSELFNSPEYKQLAEANPYANVNYRKSWGQSLLSMFGFRTNYDNYLESMATQAKEYENNLLLKQKDEEFDSPLAQVQRLAQAGLNPDLSDSISPGESAQMRDDGNPPVPPEGDIDQVANFAGFTLSALQTAFGFAGQAAGLSGLLTDNRNKKLQSIVSEDNLMKDAILNILPATGESIDRQQLSGRLRLAYGSRIKKRYIDDFVKRAGLFADGLSLSRSEFEKRFGRASDRKNYFRTAYGSDYSEVDEVMRAVSKELSDLALKATTASQYTSISQSEADQATAKNKLFYEQNVRPTELSNAKEFAENRDPATLAKNETTQSNVQTGIMRNTKAQSDFEAAMRHTPTQIIKKLNELADKGNAFASIALGIISLAYMKGLPSFSLNTGSPNKVYQFAE